MTNVLIRETETRGEGYVKIAAEIGVTPLKGMLPATRTQILWRKYSPTNTLILDFRPPELGEYLVGANLLQQPLEANRLIFPASLAARAQTRDTALPIRCSSLD